MRPLLLMLLDWITPCCGETLCGFSRLSRPHSPSRKFSENSNTPTAQSWPDPAVFGSRSGGLLSSRQWNDTFISSFLISSLSLYVVAGVVEELHSSFKVPWVAFLSDGELFESLVPPLSARMKGCHLNVMLG